MFKPNGSIYKQPSEKWFIIMCVVCCVLCLMLCVCFLWVCVSPNGTSHKKKIKNKKKQKKNNYHWTVYESELLDDFQIVLVLFKPFAANSVRAIINQCEQSPLSLKKTGLFYFGVLRCRKTKKRKQKKPKNQNKKKRHNNHTTKRGD